MAPETISDGKRRKVVLLGELAAVPPGVDHAFDHRRDDPARILNIHAPGRGFADTLRLMAD